MTNNLNYKVYLAAVKENGEMLKYVPEHQSVEIYLAALFNSGDK